MTDDTRTATVLDTTDITLACSLLCFDGFSLADVVALPPQAPNGRVYCRFSIVCPPEKLKDMERTHQQTKDGIQVGARLYDRRKKELKQRMDAARQPRMEADDDGHNR